MVLISGMVILWKSVGMAAAMRYTWRAEIKREKSHQLNQGQRIDKFRLASVCMFAECFELVSLDCLQ